MAGAICYAVYLLEYTDHLSINISNSLCYLPVFYIFGFMIDAVRRIKTATIENMKNAVDTNKVIKLLTVFGLFVVCNILACC